MLKNYIKTTYRNLLRSKGSSFINLFGLSVAIGCAILVYLFLDLNFTMDQFHENGDRVFMVQSVLGEGDAQELWGHTPIPLAPALEADFPQIERAVRWRNSSATFQTEDKVLQERVTFVDEDLLEMLTFPLKYGNKNALADQDALILSENAAIKYFGDTDPVGQQITLNFDGEHTESFTVRGVASEFPNNASFAFNALINYEKQRDLDLDLSDWALRTSATFIQVKQPTDIDAVAANLDRYLALQQDANVDAPVSSFAFGNLYTLSRNSYKVSSDITGGSHPAGFVMLGSIALFLLALACFNYMNISIASAARRLKEIGVRKVIGSTRSQLIRQFLSENILLCLLALVFGIVLAHFFLVPSFNSMFDGPDFYVFASGNLRLWGFLSVLLVVTGLVSGAYPAFYISKFEPTLIFKGKQKLTGKRWFTHSFLTFQFVMAFITMIMGLAMVQNSTYQADRDWGYNQEHTLVVPLEEAAQYAMLKNELEQQTSVLSVAGSAHHIGYHRDHTVVEVVDEKVEATRFDVGFGYLETLDLRVKSGRLFDEQHSSDAENALIVNEMFVAEQGWDEAIGQQVRLGGSAYEVIGVVEDFHYTDFLQAIEPTVLRIADEADFRYLTIRTEAGQGNQTAEVVAATWKKLIPDIPYDGFFQNTVFDNVLRQNYEINKINAFTALMALLISCMGLFGLASQNIARRMKEISVRKVLGASIPHVTQLVNRSFLLILFIAAAISTPLAYMAVDGLLDSVFAYRAPLGVGPFLIAYSVVFLTALITISTQVYKVVVANPADVLRNE